MTEFTVTESGIQKLLQHLNPRKAAGPDNLSVCFLNECVIELAPILTVIFNTSLSQGIVSGDRRNAKVTAIFKKGARQDPANYRPVSLTSICCKLLEHCIVSHSLKHLETHNILTDCQHATQIITLLHELSSSLVKDTQTDMIILYLSKTFDRVPHSRLLKKIHHYGIRGNTHKWIESFLFNRSQQVVTEGKTSVTVHVISGMFQWSVLGPLLLLMFINDLSENLTSDTILFYADAIVYRQMKTK